MAQANAQLLNQYKAGKTAEQQRVIDYFCKEEGCMSKNMSDDEYSQMVIKKRDSLNLRAKALSKIGLDEDEVNEIRRHCLRDMCLRMLLLKSVQMVTG